MAPVKPGAESLLYELHNGDPRHDEPRAMCLPAGFPSGMLYILPIQIVQNPNTIVIIPELQRAARIIPTDGRPHREGIEPTYYGDSVGHWEDDTLVIDTVNFKRWILDDYHYTDPTRTRWHSDALHTIERLRREGDTLHYQITIDDPKIFTRPFSQDFTLTHRPDWEQLGLLEYAVRRTSSNGRPKKDLIGRLLERLTLSPGAPPFRGDAPQFLAADTSASKSGCARSDRKLGSTESSATGCPVSIAVSSFARAAS
jgi:hypothetical protein